MRIDRSFRLVALRAGRSLGALDPARALLGGYLLYVLTGWALLATPMAQTTPVAALDTLFIATSAVSTTGLVTVDPGTSFTLFGEIVILALIQLGGIGYMTFGSFVVLALRHRMTPFRERMTRTAFALPSDFRIGQFIRRVVAYTLIVEAIGAAALYAFFSAAGEPAPLWSAIFHSVSAFCTAGFSLYPDSFEGYSDHVGVLLTLSALSVLGAVGFIVMTEVWTYGRRKGRLSFTSKTILKATGVFLLVGTALLFLAEPTLQSAPPEQRLLSAFFQTMTAATTVGFNSEPIGALAPATLIVLFVLMAFGASPSGTGGGLKSTTAATLWATMISVLKRRSSVRLDKRTVPTERLNQAAASLTFYLLVLCLATFCLLLTETAALEDILFEAISALGTVGLSTGLTGDLSPLGKLIVILLMVMGRLGVLTFGIAIVQRDETPEEERDNEIVL